MDSGHDAPRRENPAVADASLVALRPPVAGNRLARKVDDDVGAVDGGSPGPNHAVGRPGDPSRPAASARQYRDIIAAGSELRDQWRSQEPAPAGDNDLHPCSARAFVATHESRLGEGVSFERRFQIL